MLQKEEENETVHEKKMMEQNKATSIRNTDK